LNPPPDGPLSQWITEFVGKVPAIDTMMRWADCDYIIPVIMALILLALWFGAKNKSQRDSNHRAIIYAISAVALASIIIELLNEILDPWPRPYEVYESARFAVELIYQTSVDPSFPSNAAIVGFRKPQSWCHTVCISNSMGFRQVLWRLTLSCGHYRWCYNRRFHCLFL